MTIPTITRIFNFMLFLFCVGYLVSSYNMSIGNLREPGPGYLPVILGITGAFLSFGLFLSSVKDKNSRKLEDFSKNGFVRLLGYILSIIIFLFAFESIGIIVVFPLMLSLTKILGFRGWIKPILFSVIFTVSVYTLFGFLQVPLPEGIL